MVNSAGAISDLTLVGVGPGDRSLLTLAAVAAIEAASVVAYPVPRLQAVGMAAEIAAPWIGSDQRRLPLLFPMVSAAEPRIAAWHAAADALAAEVDLGQTVVMLCEGDVSLFASSSYVLMALRQRRPELAVRLIPGVPAVWAAAAAAAWPLSLQRQGLLIRPTPDNQADLLALLAEAEQNDIVLALLKIGQRWSWLRPLLEARGLLEEALFAQRVGWPDQLVCPAKEVAAGMKPYFSMLLLRQSWPEVMP